MKEGLIHEKLSYRIVGILFKVHNELGRYKNEKQYADKLETLLKENNINFLREFNLPQSFKGESKNRNRTDFFIENEIVIDLKAKTFITKNDYFQMQRYLTSCNKKLGLIVNFRQKFLKPRRIINPTI